MNQNNSNAQNKLTPSRRRQSRNAHASNKKTYASENDMPTGDFVLASQELMGSSPRTPQKAEFGSAAATSQPPNSNPNKSRQRNANNNTGNNKASRSSKHGQSSPRLAKAGRHTPPQTAAMKMSTAPAFAGATFHASPAPSSLPIPSFLSKAAPDSPGSADFGKLSQEPSPPPTDSETPTPVHQSVAGSAAREESPLDIFFQADRAEKEKARRAASANALASAGGPWSPPSNPKSPRDSWTLPRSPASQQTRQQNYRYNSSVCFSNTELNGTPGKPVGPAFSTPYHERIRAARSSEKPAQPLAEVSPHHHAAVDRSEALKNYLFAGQRTTPLASLQNTASRTQAAMTATGALSGATISQVQHVSATSSAVPRDDGRSADLVMMEDNLRRILKLDSPLSVSPSRTINARGA